MSVRFTKETASGIAPGARLFCHYAQMPEFRRTDRRVCEYCQFVPIQVIVTGIQKDPGSVTGIVVQSKCCHGVEQGWLDAGWYSADWLEGAEP